MAFFIAQKDVPFLSRTSIIIVWTGYFIDLLQVDLTESDERLLSKSRYFASCDLLVTSFELLVATILDRIKWNSKLPSPQIKDEAAQKPRRAISPSLIQRWWGWGVLAAGKMLSFIFPTQKGLFFPKLRVHIKDNNKSPHGKFYSFLFPFSSKFSDLNFAPYVLRSHVLTRRVRV